MTDIYDLGYQAGTADVDPAPYDSGASITIVDAKDYLAGWVLGQAALARAVRLGVPPRDPLAAPRRDNQGVGG